MPLTILSDANVNNLLENLTREDVQSFQNTLQQALHEYSTGAQDSDACEVNQPLRTSLQSSNGTTTLFMPSTSSSGIGMKVVTLAAPSNASSTPDCLAQNGDTTPHGALTIMDNTGLPTGFMNAESLTAFRTALCSSLLVRRRHSIKNITCFGAGKQAYWHIRLTLLLRGPSLKHVYIINRSFSQRARDLLKHFYNVPLATKQAEGWHRTKFMLLSPEYGEYDRLLQKQVRSADVIFCTVPSTEPLFDHGILTQTAGRKRGRLIVAIGSYKPHMIEIPPEILVQATKPSSGYHFHRHAEEGGVVVVDSLTACLAEAGEIIQAGLSPMQLVEIGELVMLRNQEQELQSQIDMSVSVGRNSQDSNSTNSSENQDEPESPTFGSPRATRSSLDMSRMNISSPLASSSSMLRPASPATPTSAVSAFNGGDNLLSPRPISRSGLSNPESRSSSPARPVPSPIQSRRPSLFHHSRTSSLDSSIFNLSKRKLKKEKEDDMSRWLAEGNVIYKSVGMGLMDLVVGGEVVRLAREQGVGVNVEEF